VKLCRTILWAVLASVMLAAPLGAEQPEPKTAEERRSNCHESCSRDRTTCEQRCLERNGMKVSKVCNDPCGKQFTSCLGECEKKQ